MQWIARNVMTVGTLLLALGAGLGVLAGDLPDVALDVAKWAMVATALGRAAVIVAEKIYEGMPAVPDAPPSDWNDEGGNDG